MDNAMKHTHMVLFSVLPEDPNLEEKTQVKVVREEDAIIFQHNAPIERGNSGGGLFDENGYLIAINSAGDPETLDNKDLIPHNYAISIDEFMKVLDLDE